MIDKPLVIRAATAARAGGPRMVIRALPGGSHTTIQGLVIDAGLTLESCHGTVHFDGCSVTGPALVLTVNGLGYRFGATTIVGCAHVSFLGCGVTGQDPLTVGCYVASSSASFTGCTLTGSSSWGGGQYTVPGSCGLYAEDSLICVRGCTIIGGGDGLMYSCGFPIPIPGPPLFVATNCEVRISGVSPIRFVPGSTIRSVWMGVTQGRVLYDPRAAPDPYQITGNTTWVATTLAFVTVAQTSSSLDFTVQATQGDTSQLFVSLPAPPIDLGGLGLSWLDPATMTPLAARVHTNAGWTHSIPIQAPLPAGLPITAQAAVLHNGAVTLSEAATFVLR
ncbi:MAG: hypothetical protein HZB39_08965 [Planctomycetes bacterium]|nr:hypothetical protein [Planctomycetota bacterium]